MLLKYHIGRLRKETANVVVQQHSLVTREDGHINARNMLSL